MSRLTIGEVARRSGVASTTLRYYESIGLLDSPTRIGGQRRYEEAVLARLDVIGMCKTAGFSLDEITLLFSDNSPGRAESRAMARGKLQEIDARIAALEGARQVIEWGMACTCPSISDCSCGIHRAKPAVLPLPSETA